MEQEVIRTILTVIFGVIAVISIVVAIRLARRKRPVWAYRTTHILGRDTQTPPELKLTFGGKEITEVYKTVFVFLNKGKDVIDISDIAENITIHFKNAEILKQTTIEVSRETNKFSVKQVVKSGDNAVELAFQWLGHNDGAIIEVFHTKSDAVTCSGEIRNVEIAQLKEFVASRPEGFYGALVVCLGFAVFLAWAWYLAVSEAIRTGADWSHVGLLVFSIMFATIIVVGLRRLLRYRLFPPWCRFSG